MIDGEFDHLNDLAELGVRVEMITRQVNEIRLVHVIVRHLTVTTQQRLILTRIVIITTIV